MRTGLKDRFGDRVSLRGNAPEILARNPEGSGWEDNAWRKGAFEVMDEESSELLFSKLQTGSYVSPKGDGSRPEEEECAAGVAMEVGPPLPPQCLLSPLHVSRPLSQ